MALRALLELLAFLAPPPRRDEPVMARITYLSTPKR